MTMAATDVEAHRSELERVLHSDLFARAPALSHLLTYLCEKSFNGEEQEIKEYSIAVDVFGRPPAFDHESDSIVRVQANRLRKHLAQYYSAEGAGNPLRISIHVGQYVPVFEPPPETPTAQVEPAEPALPSRPTSTPRTGLLVLLVAAGLIIVTLAAILLLGQRRRSDVTAREPSLPRAIDGMVGPPTGDEFRILAGATKAYVDRAGKQWLPDRYYSGGMPVPSPSPSVARTLDPEIYRHSRQGDFAYDIPLKPGNYELRLHFAETDYGADSRLGGGEGSRLMAVTANGKPLLADFDILSDANGNRLADVKVFTDISPDPDGHLHLKVSSVHGGRGLLSAIEILPGMQHRMRPVRMVMRDTSYYSDDSRWWSPDNYFSGGQLISRVDSVTGTDDPELYEGERWGHFSYAIPVPPGRYTAILHFVERRFGSANRDGNIGPPIAAGSTRRFNVLCNGAVLLKDFEILKESPERRPLLKKFNNLEPNAQGKLVFEFVPVKDYATLSAIEILPE